MSTRERFLAILLILAMVCVAGGFVGYQFVYSPWKKSNDDIKKLTEEVAELEDKKLDLEQKQFVYENKTRKKSLPADVTLARREYERLIDRMLRHAKFTEVPTIVSREPDNKSDVPTLANKKPVHTKLDFDVQIKGDLQYLVDFLYNFYRQPLLHQIRTITILKPSTGRDRDLEFTLKIQALVLDRAENRVTLLPISSPIELVAGGAATTVYNQRGMESGRGSPFTAANVLARGDDSYAKTSAQMEYRRITGKNIFFDPPKVDAKPVEEKKESTTEIDLAPFLGLTRVSHTEGKSMALIFDRYRKEDYEIECDNHGGVKVTKYYYKPVEENGLLVGDVRRRYWEKTYLEIGNEESGNLRRYFVRRILENELLLESYDPDREKQFKGWFPLAIARATGLAMPGKFYLWQVGQMLKTEDPKKSMTDLAKNDDKRWALLRPLNVDNEGEGTLKFEGDGEKPSVRKFDPKAPNKKKGRNN